SPLTAGHLFGTHPTLPRGHRRVRQDLGAPPGRPRLDHRDDPRLSLPDHLAVLPHLERRSDVLHRDGDDGCACAPRHMDAEAREDRARSDVSRRRGATMTRQTRHTLYAMFRFTVLGIWFLIVAFPMYWIIATSFKPAHEWFAWPPVYWSSTPTLENYRI